MKGVSFGSRGGEPAEEQKRGKRVRGNSLEFQSRSKEGRKGDSVVEKNVPSSPTQLVQKKAVSRRVLIPSLENPNEGKRGGEKKTPQGGETLPGGLKRNERIRRRESPGAWGSKSDTMRDE